MGHLARVWGVAILLGGFVASEGHAAESAIAFEVGEVYTLQGHRHCADPDILLENITQRTRDSERADIVWAIMEGMGRLAGTPLCSREEREVHIREVVRKGSKVVLFKAEGLFWVVAYCRDSWATNCVTMPVWRPIYLFGFRSVEVSKTLNRKEGEP